MLLTARIYRKKWSIEFDPLDYDAMWTNPFDIPVLVLDIHREMRRMHLDRYAPIVDDGRATRRTWGILLSAGNMG